MSYNSKYLKTIFSNYKNQNFNIPTHKRMETIYLGDVEIAKKNMKMNAVYCEGCVDL